MSPDAEREIQLAPRDEPSRGPGFLTKLRERFGHRREPMVGRHELRSYASRIRPWSPGRHP